MKGGFLKPDSLYSPASSTPSASLGPPSAAPVGSGRSGAGRTASSVGVVAIGPLLRWMWCARTEGRRGAAPRRTGELLVALVDRRRLLGVRVRDGVVRQHARGHGR